jgi:hypothetical protein
MVGLQGCWNIRQARNIMDQTLGMEHYGMEIKHGIFKELVGKESQGWISTNESTVCNILTSLFFAFL